MPMNMNQVAGKFETMPRKELGASYFQAYVLLSWIKTKTLNANVLETTLTFF